MESPLLGTPSLSSSGSPHDTILEVAGSFLVFVVHDLYSMRRAKSNWRATSTKFTFFASAPLIFLIRSTLTSTTTMSSSNRSEDQQPSPTQGQQEHPGTGGAGSTTETVSLVFPPLTHQRLENCAFSAWYPTFRSITIKSKIIPLSEDFITYLNADGVFIPGQK